MKEIFLHGLRINKCLSFLMEMAMTIAVYFDEAYPDHEELFRDIIMNYAK